MRTVLLLILTVGATILLAVAGLWLVDCAVPPAARKLNNEVCGNYLQTVGTIYAVLLAFVVFTVWTQQNDAGRLVERQANELADVVRLTRGLGAAVHRPALLAARDYARAVIEKEWALMGRGQASDNATALVEQLWQALAGAELQSPRAEAIYGEAVARFNEFSDARTDLLQNSRTRLPPILWILLVTGGLSNIASMYFFGLESFASLALMTASLAGAIAFVLFLIYDLDHSFSGDWLVTPGPIRAVLAQIEKELANLP